MFLGGQGIGPPSIGGRFDLLDPIGSAKYRITIPTSELKIKSPLQRDWIQSPNSRRKQEAQK